MRDRLRHFCRLLLLGFMAATLFLAAGASASMAVAQMVANTA
jgi:hypothetical protein